jgi:hypothetical protein
MHNDDVSFILTGNDPPTPPSISGPSQGRTGTSYTYTFTSIDPQGGQVEYYIDWDDGSPPTWSLPQPSGVAYSVSHTWTVDGTFIIKAKAKDTLNAESIFSTHPITMPRNKPYINSPLLRFLEQIIDQFPLLARLL